MSRRLTEEEYKRTFAYKFRRWYRGERDPYAGNVEMKREFPADAGRKARDAGEGQVQRECADEVSGRGHGRFFDGFYRVSSVLLGVVLIGMLLYMVSFLPAVGNAANPDNNEVERKYIEDGMKDTGAVNIVTGMILDYRAFDTLGESNVLFVGACTVLILLRADSRSRKSEEEENDRLYEPKNDLILQKAAFFLVPVIMIFGIYVILNGHLSPGGGFSGGAVIGAGLILYVNAFGFEKTERFFTQKTYKWVCFVSLLFYCLAKAYSFYCGAHHLETGIPLGVPGAIISAGLILPLNICVGLVVACTMYGLYALFRKGGF